MSPETLQRPRAEPSWRERSPWLGDALVIVVAGVLALLSVTLLDHRPERLDHLTVANDTDYELFIQVQGAEPGWLPLAVVSPHRTIRLDRPVDQGPTWLVRFTGQGRTADDLEITRDALRDLDWRLEVPESVGAELRAQGAPLSPPR